MKYFFTFGLFGEGILVSTFIVLCLQVLPSILTLIQFALNKEYAYTQIKFILAVICIGEIWSIIGFIFNPKLW